jgi:hypothetical protein
MQDFHLDFMLTTYDSTLKQINDALSGYGEGIDVCASGSPDTAQGHVFKIRLNTKDPTLIFDICSQFGRITSARINEEGGEECQN